MAVIALIKVLDYCSKSLERAREKLVDLKQEYADNEANLNSLNDELKTTVDRIKELEALKSPTFAEKEELETLKKENAERERQIALLKLEQELKRQEVAEKFVDVMYKDIDATGEYFVTMEGNISKQFSQYNTANSTERDYIDQQFKLYQENAKAIAELDEQYANDLNNTRYKNTRKAYEEEQTEIENYLREKNKEFQESAEGLSYIPEPTTEEQKRVNEYLDFIGDFGDRMLIALDVGGSKQGAFDRLVEGQFADSTEKLQELGQKGEVTADMLNDDQYDEFIQKLISLGFIADETPESLESVVLAFNSMGDAANDAEKDTNALNESLSKINALSGVESLSTGLDQLDKIYADIKDGGSFDFSSVLNNEDFKNAFGNLDSYEDFISIITQYPNDIGACQEAFNKLSGEYVRNSGALDNLTESTKQSTINMLKQMGIANAAEVVERELAIQREMAARKADVDAASTKDEIATLFNEVEAGSATEQALKRLVLEKAIFNKNSIKTTSDVDAILAMATAANVSIKSLEKLNRAKQLVFYADLQEESALEKGISERLKSVRIKMAEKYREEAQKILNSEIEYEPFVYSGGATTNKDTSSSSSNNEPKDFDWIEVRISRIQSAITKLKNVASSTYKSLKSRLSATKDEISKINEELSIQQKAYNRYMQEANSVGLSASLAERVRNGAIDIREYDSNTQELIEKYQNWYEKALSCKDAIEDLHESLASLYEDNFNNTQKDYENQLSLIEHNIASLESKSDLLEAKGYSGDTSIYKKLQDEQKRVIATREKELAELQKTFNAAMSSKKIEEYSEAWYSMRTAIDDVKEEIDAANISLIEYGKTIREIEWEKFDFAIERVSQLTDEMDFLIELMSGDKLFDDYGRLTDVGNATVGGHAENYSVYMETAKKYAKELLGIEKELAKDSADTELIERRSELLELQRDSILAAESEKQAIADLIQEGFDLELESLQSLIDSYTDALDKTKDLYDYQRKISDHTSEISSLQKQLFAYEGDDSAEAQVKIQQLRVELEKAQADLEETEYDQYIDDQKTMLDDLYTEYEDFLNQKAENMDALIEDMIISAQKNTESIIDTITQVGKDVSYDITKALLDDLSRRTIDENAYARGDVSGDGNVNVADLIKILDLIKTGNWDSHELSAGDINDSGSLDVGDYIAIKNAIMSGKPLISTYDVGKEIGIANVQDMSKSLASVMKNSAGTSNQFGDIHITIPIEHVDNYNDFMNQLRNDKKFEKMVQAMSIDLAAGGRQLAKNKYSW